MIAIAGELAGILIALAGIVVFYAAKVRSSARRYGQPVPSYFAAVRYLTGRQS